MNLVIATTRDPKLYTLFSPVEIISSDRGFEDISIRLDEIIYMDRQPIDWVMYATNQVSEWQWNDFLSLEKYVPRDSDTIYTTKPLSEGIDNFYCRPHVFTLLGNMYKIQYRDYILGCYSTSILSETGRLMFYAADRLGFKITTVTTRGL
jgi:hypothetical protein